MDNRRSLKITPTDLVAGWEDDMSMSSLSSSSDYDSANNGDFFYANQLETSRASLQEDDFLTDHFNIRNVRGGIDFTYIHDQDMNYYQGMPQNYNGYQPRDDINTFNATSMLGDIPEPTPANDDDFDPDYDLEVNKLLQDIEEDLKEEKSPLSSDDVSENEKVQYEDYYDEFPEDKKEEPVPDWYDTMLQKKIKETKLRLSDLSRLVCYASASTREKIIRMEQDHNTPFCKLDYPRHPPLSKPWINYWRFNCVLKCKVDPPEPNHAHTSECEMILLEHVNTGISTRSRNILPTEFPAYIMHTVEVFQEFANITFKESDKFINDDDIPDTVYEKPTWTYIKLRSNYKNELMLIACGKGVTPLIEPLKKFFYKGPGANCNVVSLYCINIKWSQKKSQFLPTFLTGLTNLRDKVGPITIRYGSKLNITFNSIEVQQLGKVVLEYLSPTVETTVIEIGCNFGALSLMLAQKCDKVIGLNTLDYEIKLAEEMKDLNNIHNASFLTCTPKEILTKCAPFVKKSISVGVLNLSTPYGKCADVMKAFRNLPTIWRVVVYGPFTKDFHRNITLLTSNDDNLGNEFLPMQGCMLDKNASNANGFDILILFERKSLIEPSIELIAAGPTVNVKLAPDDSCDSNSKNETKVDKTNSIIKKEIVFDNIISAPYKPFFKGGRLKKYGRFDSPLLPMEPKPISPPAREVIPHKAKVIDVTRPDLNIKELKKVYDSPSLPINKENNNANPPLPSTSNMNQSATEVIQPKIESNDSLQSDPDVLAVTSLPTSKKPEWAPLPKENQFNCPSPLMPKQEWKPLSTENHFNFPPPPITKPEWTPLPQENQFNFPPPPIPKQEWTPLPKENKFNCPPSSTSKGAHGWAPLPKTTEPTFIPRLPEPIIRKFDSPPLPPPKEIKKENPFNCLPSIPIINAQLDNSSIPEREISLNSTPQIKQENGPTIVKQESHFDSLPLPENVNQSYLPPLPKVEPRLSSSGCLDKEEGELSSGSSPDFTANAVPDAIIKTEPMDLDDEEEPTLNMESSFIPKCEPVSTDSDSNQVFVERTIIKTEPVDSPAEVPIISSPIQIKIKTEPKTTNISPYSDLVDFENMETPVRNPAPEQKSLTPPIEPPNFTTIEGFEFSVKPNQSFLTFKAEPKVEKVRDSQTPPMPRISVKKEKDLKAEPSTNNTINYDDDEISIIGEKKEKKKKKKKDKEKEKDERVKVKKERKTTMEEKPKYKTEVIERNKDDLSAEFDDLRKLLEERQNLQKALNQDPNVEYERSPSPVSKRYTTHYSPYSPSDRPYRSPSFRYRPMVSPPRMCDRQRRSPLPFDRRYRRSPPSQYRRSPPSPPIDRRTKFTRRSRSRSTSPLWNRTRSPSPWRSTRSPSPWRRTRSPLPRRRTKSPPPKRIRRSPSIKRKTRSPSPRRITRSPSIRRKSRSPSVRRKTKSPLSVRRKSTSMSRTELSPSPPARSCSYNSQAPNHKRKFSPNAVRSRFIWVAKKAEATGKKDFKKDKTDDQWDIPALSALSDSSPDKQKTKKENLASPAPSTSSISSSSSLGVIKQETKWGLGGKSMGTA